MSRLKKQPAVKPMLAKSMEKPFDDSNWIFETKFDGYRALASCNGSGLVKLYSRNLLLFNEKYPPVVRELKTIKHSCLLDGEIVVEKKGHLSNFQLLQNYLETSLGNLKYYVFDLLELEGNNITQLALLKRKELLKILIAQSDFKNVLYSKYVTGKGITFYKNAIQKGWEGIMAKRADSIYHINARSDDWLKIRITKQQEAVIAGFTTPKGTRRYFGSLILGANENGKLKYIGHCGTGFDAGKLKALYEKFRPLFISKSPFEDRIIPNNDVQWLKPKLVCEIKFTEWTAEENMRHPVYLGLRGDKNWKEVKIEK